MPYSAPTTREKEVLKKVVKVLKIFLRPNKIILFGSRAKGIARRGSDFDLAVDLPEPTDSKTREIQDLVNAVSGLYRVDIVYLKSVEKSFREVILETGIVIYAKRR